MTSSWPDDVIHQAFFGWSYNEGHTIIATSFDDASRSRWRSRLQDHSRLVEAVGTDLPSTAFSYLVFDDGYAAVVRRVNAGHSSGRTDANVLIGPAAALDVPLALCLERWTEWPSSAPDNGWMNTFTRAYLADAAGSAEPLRQQAERFEQSLVTVLDRLLDNPREPLSIIGCPEEDRLAMVWGLHEAADEHMRENLRLDWRWSYSTYEQRHDSTRRGLPDIVFLPVDPKIGSVHRTVVRLDSDTPPGGSAVLARQLVARLFRRTPLSIVDASPQPREEAPPPRKPANGTPAGHRGQPIADTTPGARLLAAGSVEAFSAELAKLGSGGPWDRHELRKQLDIRSLDTITEFVEITTRYELLQRLLKVLYGPQYEDLVSPDHDARRHATTVVAGCASEQLAMLVGAAAAQRGNQDIPDAAVHRWCEGGRLGGPVPAGRRTRVRRRARASRRFPIAAVLAAVALLVTVFLLGYIAGLPTAGQEPDQQQHHYVDAGANAEHELGGGEVRLLSGSSEEHSAEYLRYRARPVRLHPHPAHGQPHNHGLTYDPGRGVGEALSSGLRPRSNRPIEA